MSDDDEPLNFSASTKKGGALTMSEDKLNGFRSLFSNPMLLGNPLFSSAPYFHPNMAAALAMTMQQQNRFNSSSPPEFDGTTVSVSSFPASTIRESSPSDCSPTLSCAVCGDKGMNKDVQNERQPRNTATIRPSNDLDFNSRNFLREYAGAVSAVLSQPDSTSIFVNHGICQDALNDDKPLILTFEQRFRLVVDWIISLKPYEVLGRDAKEQLVHANWPYLLLISQLETGTLADDNSEALLLLELLKNISPTKMEWCRLREIAVYSPKTGLQQPTFLDAALESLHKEIFQSGGNSARFGRLIFLISKVCSFELPIVTDLINLPNDFNPDAAIQELLTDS
ncbi:unnamed protein product, partial [Mesorhabditis spiculigera]